MFNHFYIFYKRCILLDGILESIALRGEHEDPAFILTLNFLNEGWGEGMEFAA